MLFNSRKRLNTNILPLTLKFFYLALIYSLFVLINDLTHIKFKIRRIFFLKSSENCGSRVDIMPDPSTVFTLTGCIFEDFNSVGLDGGVIRITSFMDPYFGTITISETTFYNCNSRFGGAFILKVNTISLNRVCGNKCHAERDQKFGDCKSSSNFQSNLVSIAWCSPIDNDGCDSLRIFGSGVSIISLNSSFNHVAYSSCFYMERSNTFEFKYCLVNNNYANEYGLIGIEMSQNPLDFEYLCFENNTQDGEQKGMIFFEQWIVAQITFSNCIFQKNSKILIYCAAPNIIVKDSIVFHTDTTFYGAISSSNLTFTSTPVNKFSFTYLNTLRCQTQQNEIFSPLQTQIPSLNPTVDYTVCNSIEPTIEQSNDFTLIPTIEETLLSSFSQTIFPTIINTIEDTNQETLYPTFIPSTLQESLEKTNLPTNIPSIQMTIDSTFLPTIEQSNDLTLISTIEETLLSSFSQTIFPTIINTIEDTNQETLYPTFIPSLHPTLQESLEKTNLPTNIPSIQMTIDSTMIQTEEQTIIDTINSTKFKTIESTTNPTILKTIEYTSKISPEITIDKTKLVTIELTLQYSEIITPSNLIFISIEGTLNPTITSNNFTPSISSNSLLNQNDIFGTTIIVIGSLLGITTIFIGISYFYDSISQSNENNSEEISI